MSKKQLSEAKTCPDCGDYTTNWCKTCECCRVCKADKNKITNDKHDTNKTRLERAFLKYPAPVKCIYSIYKHENLVYIGETKRGSERLLEHFQQNPVNSVLHEKGNVNQFSYKILWDGTDYSKQERLMRESVLIQALKPKYNKQWNQED